MNVSYDAYRVFYYVARCGSFTKAAAALMSSQPNVTRTIHTLEAALGCTLFIRSSKSIALTPEGDALFRRVSVAIEQIEEAEHELARAQSLQDGVVSIGASEVALHCFLLPILGQFRQQHPGVHIRLYNHSTPQAVAALKDGLIDLAVATTPMQLQPSMKATPLKNIREAAVCGDAYAHLTGRPLSLSELTSCPMICLSRQTATYQHYAAWFEARHLTLAPEIEVATADQILPMVINNLGVGFVPEEFLASIPKQVHRLALTDPIPARTIMMVHRTDRFPGIAAKTFQSLLLSSAQ